MAKTSYKHPVSKLLSLGEKPALADEWPNYMEMDFTRAHIPELIRLVQDYDLANSPWDENDNVPPVVYGQVHAWRTLAQLKSADAVPALLELFTHVDDNYGDWIQNEVPDALGMIGLPALKPCVEFLKNRSIDSNHRHFAGLAIVQIS